MTVPPHTNSLSRLRAGYREYPVNRSLINNNGWPAAAALVDLVDATLDSGPGIRLPARMAQASGSLPPTRSALARTPTGRAGVNFLPLHRRSLLKRVWHYRVNYLFLLPAIAGGARFRLRDLSVQTIMRMPPKRPKRRTLFREAWAE